MKVRQIDKNVFNYIQKYKYVPVNRLIKEFGTGDKIIDSVYIEMQLAEGLSEELVNAIKNLRENFSIFELVVGKRLYEKLVGDPEGTNTIIYASKDGITNIIKTLFKYVYRDEISQYTESLNQFNTFLNRSESDKFWMAVFVNNCLTRLNLDEWNEIVDKICNDPFFDIETPDTIFKPPWEMKNSTCHIMKEFGIIILENVGNRYIIFNPNQYANVNKEMLAGYYIYTGEIVTFNDIHNKELFYLTRKGKLLMDKSENVSDIFKGMKYKSKMTNQLLNLFSKFDFDELFIKYR